MSWLEEEANNVVYIYKCEDRKPLMGTKQELEDKTKLKITITYKNKITFEGAEYIYAGFQPRESNVMTKIVFEKNGRKAIRIKHTDGKSHVRSMTKENLLNERGIVKTEARNDAKGNKTGKSGYEVQSVLTKDFKEATDKTKENIVQNKLQGIKKMVALSNARSKK